MGFDNVSQVNFVSIWAFVTLLMCNDARYKHERKVFSLEEVTSYAFYWNNNFYNP